MNLRLLSLNLKQFCPQLSIPVIKQRINVRYQQILGMEDWEFLKTEYGLSTVSGTSQYTIPYAAEVLGVNGESKLVETFQDKVDILDPERSETGEPLRWFVVSKSSMSQGVVTIELWPKPDDVYGLTVFYKTTKTSLTADDDEPLCRAEVVEAGSLWDCYRLAYAVTQNPAYIGLARDAQNDYQMLLRQMIIEDLSTSSLPRKVRDIAQGNYLGDDFLLDHDLEMI